MLWTPHEFTLQSAWSGVSIQEYFHLFLIPVVYLALQIFGRQMVGLFTLWKNFYGAYRFKLPRTDSKSTVETIQLIGKCCNVTTLMDTYGAKVEGCEEQSDELFGCMRSLRGSSIRPKNSTKYLFSSKLWRSCRSRKIVSRLSESL